MDENSQRDGLAQKCEESAIIAVSESAKLLRRLYVPSREHRHFELAYDLASAKAYNLTECLMSVQHAAAASIRLAQHLRDEEKRQDQASQSLATVLTASVVTEQCMWRRKLVEVLAGLVNFSSTNHNPSYFHYLLLADDDHARRTVSNAAGDWGVDCQCARRRHEFIRRTLESVGRDQVALPAWYAQGGDPARLRLASASNVIRAALRAASAQERRALAITYSQGFTAPFHVA